MMGKTVDICGISHKIVEKEYIEGDGCVLGEIEYRSCTISLRKDQTPEMYQQTLIHEIVHGMLFQIGRSDLSNDETFVQSLAMAINLTFRLKDEEEGKEDITYDAVDGMPMISKKHEGGAK